jgi:hypothetical protein
MADPHAISILRRKRDEIESTIAAYEAKLEEARRDLSAVIVTLRLFEPDVNPKQFPVYGEAWRRFKKGEVVRLCRAALSQESPLSTRELAERIMRAKGLDERDKVLRKAFSYRVGQVLRIAARRGEIGDGGKRGGARAWKA